MGLRRLKIATRGSKLALWQAEFVKNLIIKRNPSIEVQLLIVKTKGDKILDSPLAKIGGKGLFVKEIEEKLLSREADLAVHSMKDVPVELPEGLKLGVIPEREDPCDCFVSENFSSIESLSPGAKIGTSSLRRMVQVKNIREDLEIKSLRGNLDTRLKRLKEGKFDALIVAFAGLKRLNLFPRFYEKLNPLNFVPAVGQGALGIEYRVDDEELDKFISFLDHPLTRFRVLAERSFLKTLQGGCQVPVGGFAYSNGQYLEMVGFLCSLDGSKRIFSRKSRYLHEYELLGREVAEEILRKGGEKILTEIYQNV